MTEGPTALVVDDHRLLAQSLALALTLEGLPCTVADLDAPGEPLEVVRRGPAPDVVLLDLDLGPAVGDGADLVAPLCAAGSRVVVVTASADVLRTAAALERGAAGVLSKAEPIEVLVAACRRAARGEQVMGPGRREALLEQARVVRLRRGALLAPFRSLTEREAQVLRELASGRHVAAIAAAWHVSDATVRSQVRGVLTKLGVTSQLEAVAAAHAAGWASPA